MAYSLVENNFLVAPGKCACCGTGAGVDDRKFIDFGITLEFYGVVYLCGLCVICIAQDLGFVPLSQRERYETTITELESQLTGVKAENEALRYAMASILNLPLAPPVNIDSLVGRIVSDVQNAIARAKDAGESEGFDLGLGEGCGIEGSDDVRSNPANPYNEGSKGTGSTSNGKR